MADCAVLGDAEERPAGAQARGSGAGPAPPGFSIFWIRIRAFYHRVT